MQKEMINKADNAEQNIHRFERALQWIRMHTIEGHGISVTSKKRVIYPEVTLYPDAYSMGTS